MPDHQLGYREDWHLSRWAGERLSCRNSVARGGLSYFVGRSCWLTASQPWSKSQMEATWGTFAIISGPRSAFGVIIYLFFLRIIVAFEVFCFPSSQFSTPSTNYSICCDVLYTVRAHVVSALALYFPAGLLFSFRTQWCHELPAFVYVTFLSL